MSTNPDSEIIFIYFFCPKRLPNLANRAPLPSEDTTNLRLKLSPLQTACHANYAPTRLETVTVMNEGDQKSHFKWFMAARSRGNRTSS